jgi:hypothetical protein
MSRIEDNVCNKIQERANIGFAKYGETMEREDFLTLDWLSYLQEELMDAVVYIERLMEDLGIEKLTDDLMDSSESAEMVEEEPGQMRVKKNIFEMLKDYKEKIGK